MRSQQWWLMWYYKLQKEIVLVSRLSNDAGWWERCLYLGDNYKQHLHYNHRIVLKNEIVIEFDGEDSNENRRLADEVTERFRRDGIRYAKWSSGNKSTHVHTIINTANVGDVILLKRTFVRHYTQGLPLPDMLLTGANHLIRTEWGLHEKTGKKKELLGASPNYPCINEVPQAIWDEYAEAIRKRLLQPITTGTSIRKHPGFEYLLATHQFKEAGDGHERALFLLIHTLKPDYPDKKEELIKFLQDWYRYSGGGKMSDGEIRRKVTYHWDKTYTITERYLEDLLESIGRSDLCKRAEK